MALRRGGGGGEYGDNKRNGSNVFQIFLPANIKTQTIWITFQTIWITLQIIWITLDYLPNNLDYLPNNLDYLPNNLDYLNLKLDWLKGRRSKTDLRMRLITDPWTSNF